MVQINRENETQPIVVRNVQMDAMYEWPLFTAEHSARVLLRKIDCIVVNYGTVLDVKDLT